MPADPLERTPSTPSALSPSGAWSRVHGAVDRRTAHLDPIVRALMWSIASGFIFSLLNAIARDLTLQLPAMQSQFLRYVFGALVMVPFIVGAGWRAYRPRNVGGQFLRGAVHTVGLVLWFLALPRIPLADMTAIGFSGPIFIMIGAAIFLNEPMRWERWVATAFGFVGMLIVVAPSLSGSGGVWHLVMLASAPVFAASFLITKALTRYETAEVIVVWQAFTVTLFSLPLAIPVWVWPSGPQWLLFAVAGVLGSLGHYCLTRSYRIADISSTQSVKFLDLVWAAALGWIIFADLPTASALLGGAVICAATLWVARREHSRRRAGIADASDSRAMSHIDAEP